MKLDDIARELGLTELTPEVTGNREAEIERGYASDLLSDVLAHAPEGGVLVTLQVHLNVIAVASHAEMAAVIFAGGRRPEDDVCAKAVAEGLVAVRVAGRHLRRRRPSLRAGREGEPCVNVCAADLHVHTALSPCAENDMTPPAIVERALAEGLGMIAVCDHNSARNAAAVQEAAGARLTVLAGMEITTVEECHVVALFPDAAAALAAGAEVGATLGQIDDGYEAFFGEQHVLAADGRERARETLALATATHARRRRRRRARPPPRRPGHRRARRPPQLRRDRPAGLLPGRGRLRRGRALAARHRRAPRKRPGSPLTVCRWCTRPTPTTRATSARCAPPCTASARPSPNWPSPSPAQRGRSVGDA